MPVPSRKTTRMTIRMYFGLLLGGSVLLPVVAVNGLDKDCSQSQQLNSNRGEHCRSKCCQNPCSEPYRQLANDHGHVLESGAAGDAGVLGHYAGAHVQSNHHGTENGVHGNSIQSGTTEGLNVLGRCGNLTGLAGDHLVEHTGNQSANDVYTPGLAVGEQLQLPLLARC